MKQMRDFTVNAYRALLDQLQASGYCFQTFRDYLSQPEEKTVMLRHDVDDRKEHSLLFAQLQHERGIQGTYYFRMVPQSFDEGVIREIHAMGHEVGYHYEDMDFAKGDPHRAIQLFEKHLERLRSIVPVSTICMHGSPQSNYDNKDVWKYYDYRGFGIIGEPYFEIDFRKVFYLTDTGRRWDGYKVSVRDKVEPHHRLVFRSTPEIIQAMRSGAMPDQVMFNFHPQRWTDRYPLWVREKYVQLAKNAAKYWLIKMRGNASAPVRSNSGAV